VGGRGEGDAGREAFRVQGRVASITSDHGGLSSANPKNQLEKILQFEEIISCRKAFSPT
jgi:hypothetical protein